MNKRVFVDTNVLLSSNFKFEDYEKVYISIVTIEELDGLKKSEFVGYQARKAIKNIEQANNVAIKLHYTYSGSTRFLEHKNDNYILGFAYEIYVYDKDTIFLTDDYNLKIKADSLNIPCSLFEYKNNMDVFKGYKEFTGDTNFINEFFDEISKGINKYEFLINEYLILHNSDLNDTYEYRFDGEKFIELKLPPSKNVKALNSYQRCALDLLNNRDIPIKVIAGGFGSGKTLLSVKTGLYHVTQKEYYKTLMFIRNPIVADGTDIGFLPGDKSEKIYDFCRPFLQYVENEKDQFYAENLIKNEKIKMDVVSFLKGVSIDDSFVIMDEAEDLNIKLMKLVGSRIGNNSCIVFTGDWKQSENKYKQDNGLVKLINESKGNPLVGVVILEEDVRSSASKVFADL